MRHPRITIAAIAVAVAATIGGFAIASAAVFCTAASKPSNPPRTARPETAFPRIIRSSSRHGAQCILQRRRRSGDGTDRQRNRAGNE